MSQLEPGKTYKLFRNGDGSFDFFVEKDNYIKTEIAFERTDGTVEMNIGDFRVSGKFWTMQERSGERFLVHQTASRQTGEVLTWRHVEDVSNGDGQWASVFELTLEGITPEGYQILAEELENEFEISSFDNKIVVVDVQDEVTSYSTERFRTRVNGAIRRLVVEMHERRCAGDGNCLICGETNCPLAELAVLTVSPLEVAR